MYCLALHKNCGSITGQNNGFKPAYTTTIAFNVVYALVSRHFMVIRV